MRVLVTGGAGYIGAHVTARLVEHGYPVTVVDTLSRGRAHRVHPGARLITGDIADFRVMLNHTRDKDAVIHLAGLKSVAESENLPTKYWKTNVNGLDVVLHAMRLSCVPRIIFASSAAVYDSSPNPIPETGNIKPISVYGRTKIIGEWMIADTPKVTPTIFRFFNVAGTVNPEWADGDTENLIPAAIRAVLDDRQPTIYGTDYDTPDGTCIRDYIHPDDIATACLTALQRPLSGQIYNLGTGSGNSVADVLNALNAVSGGIGSPIVEDRRPGDPAVTVADPSAFTTETGWTPSHTLHDMVLSEWRAALLARGPMKSKSSSK